MPKDTTFTVSDTSNSGYPSSSPLGSIIQSPNIDSKGKPTQKSIKDAGMGRNIIKTIIAAGRNRAIVNSRILAKYNAERPYDAQKLESEGLGWRSNFTTKPLPTMIEKVAPRFTAAIDGLKYLTNSSLSSKWQNSREKTEKFRKVITKTIRARKGWRTLLDDIAFDNSIFGHTITAWLDEYCWFPRHFKQDESFCADGTKSDTQWAQIVVLKEVFLPHELFAQIEDAEAAKDAGYDLENAREAINTASPAQIRDRLNVGGTLETWYQNALRELTIGASYMAGASVIVVYSLLAREVTGKVSHYRFAGPEMLEIFHRDDRFESFEDCAAFFTFQKGNGTLHGSKGVGRDIYEMAGMVDRIRNEVVDRLIMAGKTMFQGDVKRIHTFKMSVIGSTVIVPNNWQYLEAKIDGNVEPFLKLDQYFSQLVDQLVGAVSPPANTGGEAFRSPAAWNLLAQRQEEGRDTRVGRFLEQFTNLVGSMQKRICDPETSEDDAKEAQKELLETMSREEIKEIANQPVAGTVRDLTPEERQAIAMISASKKGNPLYNQRQLEVEELSAGPGADYIERVLLPDADPTVHAEQQRQQQLEVILLSGGQPVPVSPRDNHIIHLQVLMPTAEQMAQHILEGKFNSDTMESFGAHINEHYNRALEQGTKKDDPFIEQVAEFVKKLGPALAQLKQTEQQAQQLSQQSEELEQNHMQDGSGVVPPPAPPPPPGM
jgi:hypothetical protein